MESEVRNRKTNSNKNPTNTFETTKTIRSECTPAKRRSINNERVERLLDDEPVVAAVSASEQLQNDENHRNIKSENSPIAVVRVLSSADDNQNSRFNITIDVDPMSIALMVVAFCTRIYRLAEPNNIV